MKTKSGGRAGGKDKDRPQVCYCLYKGNQFSKQETAILLMFQKHNKPYSVKKTQDKR